MQGYSHHDPFDEGYLQVSDIHRLYYAQYGATDGKPGNISPTPNIPLANSHLQLYTFMVGREEARPNETPVSLTPRSTA
jgi:hypothetical protein